MTKEGEAGGKGTIEGRLSRLSRKVTAREGGVSGREEGREQVGGWGKKGAVGGGGYIYHVGGWLSRCEEGRWESQRWPKEGRKAGGRRGRAGRCGDRERS